MVLEALPDYLKDPTALDKIYVTGVPGIVVPLSAIAHFQTSNTPIGALLALLICQVELSIVSIIGIILLIGIVKKNAIMMVDFALESERNQGLSPAESIYQACSVRFRPIMITTLAAMFGAVPLALGQGDGSEIRTPLGVAIIGGLIVSQMLTLYTTPIIYLYLDRLRRRTDAEVEHATPQPA